MRSGAHTMRRHRRLGAALGGFVLLLAFVRSSSAVRRWTDGGPAPGTAAAAATPAQQQRSHRSQGFYVQPGTEHLVAAAKEDTREVTDKVTAHNYQTLYGRLLEMGPGRRRVHKLLEIGLSKGSSTRLWRKYLPRADIWIAEYHLRYVEDLQQELDALQIKVVTGDQGNRTTLMRWVNETGGNFDLIVDDGGHTNAMQYRSLTTLFSHALKPGGVYVIEDLQLSLGHPPFACASDDSDCAIMSHVIAQWVQKLLLRNCTRVWPAPGGVPGAGDVVPRPDPWVPLLPRLKCIECSAELCAFIKCYADDAECEYPSC